MHDSYTMNPGLSPAEAASLGLAGARDVLGGADPLPLLRKHAAAYTDKVAITGAIRRLGGLTRDGILLVSLLGGVPLGIGAHHVDRSMNRGSDEEKAIRESIKYYDNASHNIRDRMAENTDEVEL